MHILYSRHMSGLSFRSAHTCATAPWRKTSPARFSSTCGVPPSSFEGRSQVSTWLLSIARFKALTALRQRRTKTSSRKDVLEIADQADTPEASLRSQQHVSDSARLCAKLSPAHREIINLVYYHEKSVEEVGTHHRHPPEHREDPDVLRPQAARRAAHGAGIDSLAA